MKPEFQAALFFLSRGDIAGIAPLGDGNINDTYTVTLRSGAHRILQRINPSVFPDAVAVMRNMRTVLHHFGEVIQQEPEQGFALPFLYAGKTGDWFEAQDGSVWRLMSMIMDSVTLSRASHPRQAEQLGRFLGFFHRLLSTIAPEKLCDTLPDIHNTAKYLRHFDKIVSMRGQPAAEEAQFCAGFIEQRRKVIEKLADDGKNLTSGVIHGDPKVDNFLFDHTGEKVVSLIDLDTVKRGLLLHDMGDALRSCCNPGGENSGHPEKMYFDPDQFHAWLTGYFSQNGLLLKAGDREHIVDFVLLITFELGLRFYTDYLAGDRYFKVHFPDQNIQRALGQFYLVRSIEVQRERLQLLAGKAARPFQNHK